MSDENQADPPPHESHVEEFGRVALKAPLGRWIVVGGILGAIASMCAFGLPSIEDKYNGVFVVLAFLAGGTVGCGLGLIYWLRKMGRNGPSN